MNDDEILSRATAILSTRRAEHQQAREAETKRLYDSYGQRRQQEPHDLGSPRKLLPEEALLLVALERTKYIIHTEKDRSRWHGNARCRFNLRGTALSLQTDSRLELLWELWAAVSDQVSFHRGEGLQTNAVVTLTEAHLQGSVVRRDLRRLDRELKAQDQQDTQAEAASAV